MIFHNCSNYDYYFLHKDIEEEFKRQFECLGETTQKCINSQPIQKQNENSKTITCKIKFFDIVRFMDSSLSRLADNPPEELHKGICKNCKSGLEYAPVKTRKYKKTH